MLRENCGRRGAAGSDFAGARVSSGSSAVVASRGGRPRATGRRRGRATAWVWCSPREKESQPMGVAGSSSISWTTFLRSQSPGFCDAFSSEKGFQRFSRAEFSILPGGRGRSAAAGAAVRRRRGPTAAGRRIRGLRRCRGRRGGALFCIEVVVEELVAASAVVGGGKATCSRRARDDGGRPGGGGGGGGGGEPPPRRRRLRGQRGPLVQPRWRRSWELGGSRPLAAVRVPRKSRCGGKRRSHAAPASAIAAAAAAATSPRAPPAGKGGACARGGPSGAGVFAPRQRACPRRGAQFLRSPPRDAAPESSRWPPLTAARPLPRSAGARDRLSPWW